MCVQMEGAKDVLMCTEQSIIQEHFLLTCFVSGWILTFKTPSNKLNASKTRQRFFNFAAKLSLTFP